jgi:hypothetical protein
VFRITVNHRRALRTTTSPASQQEAFLEFWRAVAVAPARPPRPASGRAAASEGPEAEFDRLREMEAHWITTFPRKLKDLLVDALPGLASGRPPWWRFETISAAEATSTQKRKPEPDFEFFITGEIVYGSMTFDLGIAGIKEFLELFNNNFDLIWPFLSMYVPVAFADSVGGSASDYASSVEGGASLALAAQAAKPPPVSDFRKWLIVNLSLVVPVLLMLAVGWVLLDHYPSVSEAQDKAWEALSKQQNELIKTLSNPATSTCCCLPPAPAPNPPSPHPSGPCARAAIAAQQAAVAAAAAQKAAEDAANRATGSKAVAARPS